MLSDLKYHGTCLEHAHKYRRIQSLSFSPAPLQPGGISRRATVLGELSYLGLAPRAEASFLACASAAARLSALSATAAAAPTAGSLSEGVVVAGSCAAGSDASPPRGFVQLPAPEPTEEPTEEERAVAVEPLLAWLGLGLGVRG